MFLKDRDVDSKRSMIRSQSPVRIDGMIGMFHRFQPKKHKINDQSNGREPVLDGISAKRLQSYGAGSNVFSMKVFLIKSNTFRVTINQEHHQDHVKNTIKHMQSSTIETQQEHTARTSYQGHR